MIPTVVIVGADKGGVGKTTVARTALDYLAELAVPVRAFDTQQPDGTLVRFAPSAAVVDIAEVADQMRIFDGVTAEAVTVVDICAGMLLPTLKALDAAQLLADVRAGLMRLVVLHVLGETVESIAEIGAVARTIAGDAGDAHHFLVKNYIHKGQFSDWDSNPQVSAIMAASASRTITVPQLEPVANAAVQNLNSSFAAFAATNPSRYLRGLMRTWLNGVWGEFDRVGLRGLVIAPPAPVAAAAS